MDETEIRHLSTPDEYQTCFALQKETWGQDFNDAVPASILMVSQKVGGVTAGAFDAQGEMIGCVYGMTGYTEGRPVHWSDILAVKRKARGTGLGKRLKMFQRDELLKQGVETMRWTYDPLQALNANLNFNALGALPVEYVVDMYNNTGSDLHAGLGTDRFIVEWRLASEHVERTLAGEKQAEADSLEEAPVVNTRFEDGQPVPFETELPEAGHVRIEVPASIDTVKANTREVGLRWRESTRRAFTHYLGRGLQAARFVKDTDGRCFYLLQSGKM